MPAVKANKLSIYLIKPSVTRLQDMIESQQTPVHIDGVGDFYYDESHPKTPDWIRKFFGSNLNSEIQIMTSSAKGVLIAPVQHGGKTHHFAVVFGVGRFLLKESVIEERFGLRVVLNSADPESIRSIDKTTLGSVPKHSREQMSRDTNAKEFGIDIEQDLVGAVTARSRDEQFGKTISGRDPLSVSVPVDITNIIDFLKHCLTRYNSNDYKKDFGWVEQIAEVRDSYKVGELEALLVDKLSRRDLDKIWMAVPEVVPWEDVEGFKYIREKSDVLHPDIGMKSFLETLGDRPLTVDTLGNEAVFMISASTGVATRWSAHRCTYAEIEHNGTLYVLTGNKWYAIAKDFSDKVLSDFAAFPASTVSLPDFTQKDEGAYNKDVAASEGFCCMDSDNIQHGGGHSSVEFCDLLTPDKKIIHVKRYVGSSTLSHLFAQGAVSGELFASDPEFRKKLNEKLPDAYKLADPTERPRTEEYEIVYAIVSYSEGDLEIPFFSKVNLRAARNRLALCGYGVSLKKISKVEPSAVIIADVAVTV
jgi:uncharacterized protein (TIGR04141 family)